MIKQKIKPFNNEMNLLKMIGIVHVVVGHIYSQLFSILRQSYTFHMPLFYFISGYFYNEDHENNKIKYSFYKIKKDLTLFFLCYLFLICFSYLLKIKYSVNLGNFSFDNFFVKPFTMFPVFLAGPAWFVLSLLEVQIMFLFVYQFLKKIKSNFIKLIFFIFLGVISIYLSNIGFNKNVFFLFFSRILFGMMFYYFGYFYKKNIENKINIFNGKILCVSLIIISILMVISPPYMNIVVMDFGNHLISPIISALLGIYISLFIAKSLNFILKDKNDILNKIGRSTYYIMFFHFFTFFIINFLYLKITKAPDSLYSSLSGGYICPIPLLNINKFWFLYVSCGLLLPTFFGEFISFLKRKKFLFR